jgi:hypothetical protein
MGPEQTAIKSCDWCLHKTVCILCHGYSQLELRFGNPSPVDSEEFMHRLSETLASKCGFYLASNGANQED